jgi:hypothetical protein
MMHGPINVKSPNNISKWQMGFNSAFKELSKNVGSLSLTKGTVHEVAAIIEYK